MTIRSVNPATGEIRNEFAPLTAEEIERRLQLASAAFDSHRTSTFALRSERMRSAAAILESETNRIARTMTEEMGKTLVSAEAEVRKCVSGMRYFADSAAELLADEGHPDPAVVDASAAGVRYRPLGVILAVMPWNFPLWQVLRFAAPAVMAGNVCLLKHASNVPLCALYIEDLFRRAGFSEGCFQTLLIGSGSVEAVLRDRRVAAATVTGGEAAGRSVASVAGDEVKPTVLELGGSDAFIVMPSADLERAATTAVRARVQNNGQSCIAAKRFIVHETVHEAFLRRFVDGMRALRVGDPLVRSNDLGPLATEAGRTEVHELVDDARHKGATIHCGGTVPAGPGWFYPPTVIADITPEMRLHHEEAFGPVATVYPASDLDDAIALANATDFGLGASAWTADPSERARLLDDLHAGAVFVNGMTVSHPSLPFGGVKRSGYGRELGGAGIRAFCNMTTVWDA